MSRPCDGAERRPTRSVRARAKAVAPGNNLRGGSTTNKRGATFFVLLAQAKASYRYRGEPKDAPLPEIYPPRITSHLYEGGSKRHGAQLQATPFRLAQRPTSITEAGPSASSQDFFSRVAALAPRNTAKSRPPNRSPSTIVPSSSRWRRPKDAESSILYKVPSWDPILWI